MKKIMYFILLLFLLFSNANTAFAESRFDKERALILQVVEELEKNKRPLFDSSSLVYDVKSFIKEFTSLKNITEQDFEELDKLLEKTNDFPTDLSMMWLTFPLELMQSIKHTDGDVGEALKLLDEKEETIDTYIENLSWLELALLRGTSLRFQESNMNSLSEYDRGSYKEQTFQDMQNGNKDDKVTFTGTVTNADVSVDISYPYFFIRYTISLNNGGEVMVNYHNNFGSPLPLLVNGDKVQVFGTISKGVNGEFHIAPQHFILQ